MQRNIAPKGSLRESKRPHTYSSYVALLSDIIDAEPSSFKEAVEKKVWKDAMHEEYQSIMKNDVWDVVPRPEGKSVMTSKWIYKIKHVADGSIPGNWCECLFVVYAFFLRKASGYEPCLIFSMLPSAACFIL